MSDSEATTGPLTHAHPHHQHDVDAHPHMGGKSLQSLERPRYKSWRKKYRKMRHEFDGKLEENKRLFKEQHQLEAMAKRLREELDGLLEMCLDLNQNPSILPELRYNLSQPSSRTNLIVPPDITPEAANDMLLTYKQAVQEARIPPVDLHVIRAQIEQRLAEQEATRLQDLERTVPQPEPQRDEQGRDGALDEGVTPPPGYLTSEQETDYFLRLDAKIDPVNGSFPVTTTGSALDPKAFLGEEDKHIADLTPRELERQIEYLNPQSQHNWLKTHAKLPTNGVGGDADDNESLASHDAGGRSAVPKKRGGNKNLAKQVGDRAVERAREGVSPGAASGFEDQDELSLMAMDEPALGSGRKKGRDPDGAYRVKGGKSGGSSSKGKRKRSGEEIGGVGGVGGSSKKARVEGLVE